MTDFPHGPDENVFGDAEPARDVRLGALLRDHLGEVPMHDVDFASLSARISRGIASQVTSPWWSYAARWERRALPLALAAGLAAAAALWSLGSPAQLQASADPVAEVINGAPADAAARLLTRSMTGSRYDSSGDLE